MTNRQDLSQSPASLHTPVLADAVIQLLQPQPGQTLVDATLGGGGHARLLLDLIGNTGCLIGIDRDPQAVQLATTRLAGLPIQTYCASFADLPEVVARLGHPQVDGILIDLGVSSDQLAAENRGFSFRSSGPLDLRFNAQQGEPAYRLLERLKADQIAELLWQYGEERYRGRIARAIVMARHDRPIRTAAELAEVVTRAVPPTYRRGRLHPATRTFQALRIVVNDELEHLQRALQQIPECLRVGGRVAVISFHSLEDRLVKTAFRTTPQFRPVTKKPVRPGPAELARNPRSRSARLRAAERVEPAAAQTANRTRHR